MEPNGLVVRGEGGGVVAGMVADRGMKLHGSARFWGFRPAGSKTLLSPAIGSVRGVSGKGVGYLNAVIRF